MTTLCRSSWRNCALHTDAEMAAIDAMEDRIIPISEEATKIRQLITSLELCHHKAERWVYNIVEAIGTGETTKGMGTRLPGQTHPKEITWRNACDALTDWCTGIAATEVEGNIDGIPAYQLIDCLGERTPLKVWQVQRVVERIRSYTHWPHSYTDPATQYELLIFNAGEYEFSYLKQCPERYKEHEDFWYTTATTIIHDTVFGNQTDLSLAIAIDMLWPCHWNFVENLQTVLEAIGGNLNPDRPFTACGRNITLVPIRPRLTVVANTLRVFCGESKRAQDIDKALLAILGEPTEDKLWLAASLEKTIRLQLDPPKELREAAILTGPEWIQQ